MMMQMIMKNKMMIMIKHKMMTLMGKNINWKI